MNSHQRRKKKRKKIYIFLNGKWIKDPLPFTEEDRAWFARKEYFKPTPDTEYVIPA